MPAAVAGAASAPATPEEETRNDLTDFLRRHLLGPGGGTDLLGRPRLLDLRDAHAAQPELLLGSPTGIYSTGILFPPARPDGLRPTEAEQDEDRETAEAEGGFDLDPSEEENPAPPTDIDPYADELPADALLANTDEPTGVGSSDDDDAAAPVELLRNFHQLYPRYLGLSCCLPAAAGAAPAAATVQVRGRYYARVEDKRQVALWLPDADTNPHYARLLTGPAADPDLQRYFELRAHAGRTVLAVQHLPDDADDYRRLDRAIQRVRTPTSVLFSAKGRHDEAADPEPGAAAVPAGGLLRAGDRLHYAPAAERTADDEQQLRALTDRIANLQQQFFAYQALQKLAVPLRTDGQFDTYWQAREVACAVPVPLGEWDAEMRPARFVRHILLNVDTSAVLAPEAAPPQPSAFTLRLHVQLRHDPRTRPEAVYVKVQAENFSEPVPVSLNGRYPAFRAETVAHSLFGLELRVWAPRLLSYRRAGGAAAGADPRSAEEAAASLLHRHQPPYAIGHGVAARWGCRTAGGPVDEALTDYLPCRDTPDISPSANHALSAAPDARRLPADEVLRFQWLADFGPGTAGRPPDADVLAGLRRFAAYYEHWITTTQAQALAEPGLRPNQRELVRQEMACCARDLARICRNIDLLDEARNGGDPVPLRAFRQANAAMFVQLWHAAQVGKNTWAPGDPACPITALAARPGEPAPYAAAFYAGQSDCLRPDERAAWRPFQLAFVLLNVDGFVRPPAASSQALFALNAPPIDWHERNALVDLVWFPTGGGKTEAYLGLIAFCALLRRHRDPATGGGTAVLMRYTLRLLTLQQFQRATRLVLALEIVRHWPEAAAALGPEPFSIGLWVGSQFLPNKLRRPADDTSAPPGLADLAAQIQAAVANLRPKHRGPADPAEREALRTQARAAAGKIPLVACPCCGTELFDVATGRYGGPSELNEYTFSCLNDACLFSAQRAGGRLPVRLCDELLYRQPPTLLFGTVDKFATLAHKVHETDKDNDSRRLFGRRRPNGRPKEPHQWPPDLIIQDELHLLQGPLGSSVALFEAVLDQLCRTEAAGPGGGLVRAKVISSTATTRNTALQVWALYDRQVNVFPKSGVQASDSFFAVHRQDAASGQAQSKRRYLGVCPTGKTMLVAQRRLLALLLAHRLRAENSPAAEAPREQLIDAYYSVVAYYGSLREVGKTASQMDTFLRADYQRLLDQLLLTVPTHYSYRHLSRIELTGRMNDNQVKNALRQAEQPYRLAERRTNARPAPDLLLATNMISVGLDIDRLNVMLVNGIPKSMAEYIQASSRVARRHAGLVVALHHPLRPRDVSHYEHFTGFHQRLYAYVEPLSITPFTGKALARYLPTVLAALVRQRHAAFAANLSADALDQTPQTSAEDLTADVLAYFEQRHRSLAASADAQADANIANLLGNDEYSTLEAEVRKLVGQWQARRTALPHDPDLPDSQQPRLAFGRTAGGNESLYAQLGDPAPAPGQWPVNYSLREVELQTALKIELQ